MNVLRLDQNTARAVLEAVSHFEREFSYPLGGSMRFSISHGADYCLFYKSLGDSATFVIDRKGVILGAVSVSVRNLACTGRRLRSAYVGDLKLLPEARKGFNLLRLVGAAESWVRSHHSDVQSAFGVVMDGTESTPDGYTGRAGIPPLQTGGHLSIFCLDLSEPVQAGQGKKLVQLSLADDKFTATFAKLSRDSFVIESGQTAMRSRMAPLYLVATDGAACGCLEDTYEAKNLLLDNGGLLKAAHLTRFAFSSPQAGLDLVHIAAGEARFRGYEYLFFALDTKIASAFEKELGCSLNGGACGATIFASESLCDESKYYPWLMSTSEV